MENLFYNISQVLGITIIHSLWQGLIIYIVLRVFMLVFPAAPAAVKYRLAYSALAITLCWFLYTLFNEMGHYAWFSTKALTIAPITLPAVMHQLGEPASKYYITISGYMPYLTMIYIVGLVFNTLKLSLAWNSIYRIRQNISEAGFEGTITRLSKKLSLTKTVQAAFSEWVDVPCITGFIKPMILLPFSITCYLSAEETEAILLHELAHIKRNDYLLNFIQQVIGILLFFNPFARLVSKIINEERENCCDDLVVQVTGSPFIYAQALLKLEENKQQHWQLALAASGKKYELLNRIERIMKTKTQTINIRPVLITLLALTFSISSIAWLNPEIKDGKVTLKNAEPAMRIITAAITTATPTVKTSIAAVPVAVPKHTTNLPAPYYTVNYPDSTRFIDTTKKAKKYKIVVEDDQGNKKEYNSVNELPDADKNEFYKNSDGIYGMALPDTGRYLKMREYYPGEQLAKQGAELARQATKMAEKFKGPDYKKYVEDAQKYLHSPEFKKYTEDAQNYLHSPEFKKYAEDMQKYMHGPEFKKYAEDMQKSAEEMAKYYDSPEWKKQVDEMQKQGADMAKYYDSPEWKKQVEEIQKQAEDMQKEGDAPEIKEMGPDVKIIMKAPKPVAPPKVKIKEPVPPAKVKPPKLKKPEKIAKPEAPEKPEKKEKPGAKEKPEPEKPL